MANEYFPSFYFLRLSSTGVINFRSSDFIHEYLHYLQDLTTTACRIHHCNVYNTLKGYASELRESQLIARPVDLSELEHQQVNAEIMANFCQSRSQAIGVESAVGKKHIQAYHAKEVSCQYKGRQLSFSEHYLRLTDETRTTSEEYRITARDFLETQANLIESKLFATPRLDFFPYNTIIELLKCVYPAFVDEQFIVELIEACLMTGSPVETFFILVEKMKAIGLVPRMRGDAVDFMLRNIIAEDFAHVRRDPMQLYNIYCLESIETLNGVYRDPNVLRAKEWIQLSIERAKDARNKSKLLISDLFSSGVEEIIGSCVPKLGLPIMINASHHLYMDRDSADPSFFYLLATKGIYDYLETLERQCPLYDDCVANNMFFGNSLNYQMDADCSLKPFQMRINGNHCPFSYMWSSWGLPICLVQ